MSSFEQNKKLVFSEKDRLGLTADQIKDVIKLFNYAKACKCEFTINNDKLIIKEFVKPIDKRDMDELTGNKNITDFFNGIFK